MPAPQQYQKHGQTLGNVGFQVECAVLEQFGADLHQVGELVGVDLLLSKGGIALRVAAFSRCPLSHRMGCSNGNLRSALVVITFARERITLASSSAVTIVVSNSSGTR